MNVGETKIVDPLSVLKASRRFDLIFKVSLAKAWTTGTPDEQREAEQAYLEAVRARNGFYECEPFRDKPDDFLNAFRRTAASIRENGYDMSKPAIPVDPAGELLNGAHRLATCVVFGCKCPVVVSDMYPAGGSVLKTFVAGHIHPAVMHWGMRKYLQLLPDGVLAADFEHVKSLPVEPFPDWVRRNRAAWPFKLKSAISLFWLVLTLPLKRGAKKAKQRRRILRERKKISGFSALAEFWKTNHQQ